MICSFFGHRKVPDGLGVVLETQITAIIEGCKNDVVFYVGDKGQFDRLVQLTLRRLTVRYPEIKAYVVLDTIPEKENCFGLPTLLPEEIEKAPRRFAMAHRNKWMAEICDLAIVYMTDITTNTRKYTDMLKTKNKTIINIADIAPFFLDNPDFMC